ncbi:MAG: trehalose-phosphatase [Scytonema sp. RU_4_4]|nr:trehalose-phosphatase [Scytonema sp. RU_4_4]
MDYFFDKITEAEERLLLLDYDGTLAPFRVERDKAFPYPEVTKLLKEIIQTQTTRIVIITGRSIKDIIPLLNLDPIPEIWGSHGWEHLSVDGKYTMTSFDNDTKQALADARDYIASLNLLDYCEQKPASIAVHWRGLAADIANLIHTKVMKKWTKLTEQTKLEIRPFNGGIELCVMGKNKGTAVQTIISGIGAKAAVAYLGDDLTDEDAFNAVKPRGVSVLVCQYFRPTAADLWLKPPKELVDFLSKWKQASSSYFLDKIM